MHAYINIGLNFNMVNIYKSHHCSSLLATPGTEPATCWDSRSQSGDANHSAIPPPMKSQSVTLTVKLRVRMISGYWAITNLWGVPDTDTEYLLI